MLEIRIPDWLEFPSKEQALKYGEQAEVSVFLKAEAIFLLFDGSKEKILPQQTELYQFSYLKEKTYDHKRELHCLPAAFLNSSILAKARR